MVVIRKKETSSCCGGDGPRCECQQPSLARKNLEHIDSLWSDGVISTDVGDVPRVVSALQTKDKFGTLKVRRAAITRSLRDYMRQAIPTRNPPYW